MSFDLFFQNAVRLHQAGHLDEAETQYRQLLEISPENTDLLHLLGMLAVQKGAHEAGITFLLKAVKLSPQSAAYRFTLAHALQESGHPKEALEHYKHVIDLDSSIPEIYNNMGIIFRQLNQKEEAVSFFKKALDINSQFAPAYINLGLAARENGQNEEALSLFKKAIEIDPQEAEGYAQTAVTFRQSGRYTESEEFYGKAIERSRENSIYWNGLGIVYEQQGKIDNAFNAYETAIRFSPRFADAYNNRANIYAKTGKHWEAEADFKTAVKIDPDYAEAFNNLGALLYEHERYQEALECYRKAFIINPGQAETCNNLAMAVKSAGDMEEAIGLYFHAMMLNPALEAVHHNLYHALYDLYVHENQPDTAKHLAKKWLDAFPENPVAGHLYASFNQDTPEKAGPEYIRKLFDSFAGTFEKTLQDLSYRIPELVQKTMQGKQGDLDILDAGCGTGLCAGLLKPYAKKLYGVDLSEKMVEEARKKNIYDDLQSDELTAYLSRFPAGFDLILMADVGCYFGTLEELSGRLYQALRENGELIMTLEASADNDFVLQPSGRFAHKKSYIAEALQKSGFGKVEIIPEILRHENQKPVNGFLIKAFVKKNEKEQVKQTES